MSSVYAICPSNTGDITLSTAETCSVAGNSYGTFVVHGSGAILNATNPNLELITTNNDHVIRAYNGGLINIEGNLLVDSKGTGRNISAVAANGGSIVRLNGSSNSIYHNGNNTEGAGLVIEQLRGMGVGASYIYVKGKTKIITKGAPGILARLGGGIEVQDVNIHIGNNGNKGNQGNQGNNGIYVFDKDSYVQYKNAYINSSGIGLRAINGGKFFSTSTGDANFDFIKITSNLPDPNPYEVEKIKVVGNVLSPESLNSVEITVLKDAGDKEKLIADGILFEEISILTKSTEITTLNTAAHALSSTGVNSLISLDGTLRTTTIGNNTSGLYAGNGGNIEVKGPVILNSEGNNSTGLTATGINSTITLLGNVTSTGEETAINNNSNATINLLGLQSEFAGNAINNNATISLANGVLGGKLKIGGTYTGNNGLLVLDTDLADDNSKTDFVEIGDKADGVTKVDIKSGNSQGAPTKNGIKVIQTQSSKDGVFVLAGTKGYITAGGVYDYYLEYREKNTNQNNTNYDNWYLMNYDYKEEDHIYTPDIGEYLATETMGNTLFTSRLEDREGASQYQNLGNSKDVGNVWVRAYGSHNQFKTMNSQLETTGNSFVTQIGAGLVTLGEEDQYNLGAMTGFAYYDGKTRSNVTDRESKTKIDGYSLGLYGTWYAHPIEKRGAYIDSWVLWNKFNNKIDTPDQNQYKYDSSGITASIEVGGDYLINKNGKKNWWIQPQSQIIYQSVHADDFKDAQGVGIYHGKDNVQARMGIKTYLNIPTNGNKLTSYRPYIALNFIHNTNPYSVVIDDVRYENEGSNNLGEIKVGIEGNTTKNSQVWLNASYVAGSHSNQVYQGNIGWKYNF